MTKFVVSGHIYDSDAHEVKPANVIKRTVWVELGGTSALDGTIEHLIDLINLDFWEEMNTLFGDSLSLTSIPNSWINEGSEMSLKAKNWQQTWVPFLAFSFHSKIAFERMCWMIAFLCSFLYSLFGNFAIQFKVLGIFKKSRIYLLSFLTNCPGILKLACYLLTTCVCVSKKLNNRKRSFYWFIASGISQSFVKILIDSNDDCLNHEVKQLLKKYHRLEFPWIWEKCALKLGETANNWKGIPEADWKETSEASRNAHMWTLLFYLSFPRNALKKLSNDDQRDLL